MVSTWKLLLPFYLTNICVCVCVKNSGSPAASHQLGMSIFLLSPLFPPQRERKGAKGQVNSSGQDRQTEHGQQGSSPPPPSERTEGTGQHMLCQGLLVIFKNCYSDFFFLLYQTSHHNPSPLIIGTNIHMFIWRTVSAVTNQLVHCAPLVRLC